MELTGVVVEICVVMGIADVGMEPLLVAKELRAFAMTLAGVVMEHLTFVVELDGATREMVAVEAELIGVVIVPETVARDEVVGIAAISTCFELFPLTS